MVALPSGTVSMLFSDVEGSTLLLARLGERYVEALEGQRQVLRAAWKHCDGVEMGTEGDSFFVVFRTAESAVNAAVEAQQGLANFKWPSEDAVRVRMGIHTGSPLLHDDGYVGMDVHMAARIAASAHGSQIVLSAATAALVKNRLPPGTRLRDLGTHQLKDMANREHLFQLCAPGLPTRFPPLKTLGAASNLPLAATPLIGRDNELIELESLLSSAGVRLVTLTGPGGTGKTRLAVGLAERTAGTYPSGVYFVPLSGVTDAGRVVAEIAAVLGVQKVVDLSLEDAIIEHLQGQPRLLVLDNFEQVMAAAGLISRLLEAAPALSVVVTSRIALRLERDHEYSVGALSMPATKPNPDPAELIRVPAVELFVSRARAVNRSFECTHRNAAAIAKICVRLDGLPLAIELAAARVNVLSANAISDRLSHCLDLLTYGGSDRPSRHRTLRGTIDWSFALLDRAEQGVLIDLSVFVGSFSLEAAEEVCGRPDDVSPLEILDSLARLIDNSLVQSITDAGELRFELLETVRQYAAEHLSSPDESRTLSSRHATYFLGAYQAAQVNLLGPEAALVLQRLDADYSNALAALEWALAESRAPLAGEFAIALEPYWLARGRLTEGRGWLAVVRVRDLPEMLAMGAAISAGTLAYCQSDWGAAREALESGLSISRRVGDPVSAARSLALLGAMAVLEGEVDQGRVQASEALQIARKQNLYEPRAVALSALAIASAVSGDFAGEKRLYHERLEIVRKQGDRARIADTLNTLAEIALDENDLASGRAWAEEALELAGDTGTLEARDAMLTLARLALAAGDVPRALVVVREAIASSVTLGQVFGLAQALRVLGAAECRQDNFERCVRLFAAAQELHPAPSGYDSTVESDLNTALAAARERLGPTGFAAAWESGVELPLEDVLR